MTLPQQAPRPVRRVSKRRSCSGPFTTFYKPLRWLDTLLLAGLYSLALVRVSGPLGEDQNVQEMAIDGPHSNASDAGVGHCAPGGRLDGFQHLEPEAHPAVWGRRSCDPA